MSSVSTHLVNGGDTLVECGCCHNPHCSEISIDPHTGVEAANLKLIRKKPRRVDGALDIAVFQQKPDNFAFAEDNEPWCGICQTCHTENDHHTNDDSADHTHNVGANCISCHPHSSGFTHGGGSGGDCDECHGKDADMGGTGTTQSHSTHTENDSDDLRGPNITCADCHDTDNFPYFKSGNDSNSDGNFDLSETDVCDVCHSPGGAYDGVDDPWFGAKANWDTGVYEDGYLLPGREEWCAGCHDTGNSVIQGVNAPPIAGDGITWGYFASGHGSHAIACTDCHDSTTPHIDGEARTYAFDSSYYGPSHSGVAYAASYRLQDIDGEVPLMIPANYNITFSYNAQTMKNNAFRLCFDCHDSSMILDDTPGDGIDSNFKASRPNPPRNYSYAWGSGADTNEHVAHIMNYVGPFSDSDWDTGTIGPGGQNGRDTMTMCFSCHNVHGAEGSHGSTNEAMIRDGILAGRTGYGFSYVIEDVGNGGYPWVTSTDATQSTSVGAIFRNNTADMCGGSMCHGTPAPPSGSSYNASGSSWGTFLEYFRP